MKCSSALEFAVLGEWSSPEGVKMDLFERGSMQTTTKARPVHLAEYADRHRQCERSFQIPNSRWDERSLSQSGCLDPSQLCSER